MAKKQKQPKSRWQMRVMITADTKAELAAVRRQIKAACSTGAGGGVVVAFEVPSPTCGGPGDPCQ